MTRVTDKRTGYLELLEKWVHTIPPYLYRLPDNPELVCYGLGYNGHWFMQANNTVFSALAVLAKIPALDISDADIDREHLLDYALALLRFCLHTHISGERNCLNGKQWGHSWISALCLERAIHGIEELREDLTCADEEALRRVLLSECDWLADCYHRKRNDTPGAVTAGLTQHNNPESNMWNGALLHRTALLYPESPRADEYREKGTRFILNAISVDSDKHSADTIAGKPLSEWHIGGNFFDSFACNHHGYLNIGYMVITLSNLAMLHFFCRQRNLNPPDGLYHNAEPLWQLVKTCTFPDGRLLRTGGDSRARYCYCQDYAIPVWLLAQDVFNDHEARRFEDGWLAQVEREQQEEPKGFFLKPRLEKLENASFLYYTRLEGDRAGSLAMGDCWRRLIDRQDAAEQQKNKKIIIPSSQESVYSRWSDSFHGAYLHRNDERITSWTWKASEKPQGLCLPPDMSDMAEWRYNMAGRITGEGQVNDNRVLRSSGAEFPGGFTTQGRFETFTDQHISEGESEEVIAYTDSAFIALPDGHTVACFQRAVTACRVRLKQVKGLFMNIPNDIYNDCSRCYYDRNGVEQVVRFQDSDADEWLSFPGKCLNIDNKLGITMVYGDGDFGVFSPGRRQVTIRRDPAGAAGGSLHTEEICSTCITRQQFHEPHSTLFDLAFLVHTDGNWKRTRSLQTGTERVAGRHEVYDVRTIRLQGADGRCYFITVNFGDTGQRVSIPTPSSSSLECVISGTILHSAESGYCSIPAAAGDAAVFRMK